MPKLIDNLQDNILACARKILLNEGWSAFSMRRIAAACGIAVGTLYNYYSSKMQLAAAVMYRDWTKSLLHMHESVLSASSVQEGLLSLFDEIRSFSAVYRPVWDEAAGTKEIGEKLSFYHPVLMKSLREEMGLLFSRDDRQEDPALLDAAAEMLLACAVYSGLTREQVQLLLSRI